MGMTKTFVSVREVREAIEIAFEEYKHDIGSMLDHDEIT